MPEIRPATQADVNDVTDAIHYLQKARDLLSRAGCNRAVHKVRMTLKSAEGAKRHVDHRYRRTTNG